MTLACPQICEAEVFLLRHLSVLANCGYVAPPSSEDLHWVLSPGAREAVAALTASNEDVVVVVLTTFIGRGDVSWQVDAAVRFGHQIDSLYRLSNAPKVLPLVAMQWDGDYRAEAESCLHKMVESSGGVALYGMLVNAKRKQASLNLTISIAEQIFAKAVCWIDDDVNLSSQALAKMWETFAKGDFRGAVGARKIGVSRANYSSKALARAKSLTGPAMNYPHGCCLLVDISVVKGGIPPRFASDDGFVCFELLRPLSETPMDLLRICEHAICYHEIGAASAYDNWMRIRRMQINHHIMIGNYLPSVGEYYLRSILFWDLWPIGRSAGKGISLYRLKRWSLKAIHFAIFVGIGLEMSIRALTKTPLKGVPWGGSQRPTSK